MVHINSEGKFGDNYYLLDGMTMSLQKFLAIYIIENNGERLNKQQVIIVKNSCQIQKFGTKN